MVCRGCARSAPFSNTPTCRTCANACGQGQRPSSTATAHQTRIGRYSVRKPPLLCPALAHGAGWRIYSVLSITCEHPAVLFGRRRNHGNSARNPRPATHSSAFVAYLSLPSFSQRPLWTRGRARSAPSRTLPRRTCARCALKGRGRWLS